MSRKIFSCLTVLLIIVTCTACKATADYQVKDYLISLANQSGINDKNTIDEVFPSLLEWKIVVEEDKEKLSDNLEYKYLAATISKLINEENGNLDTLKAKGYIEKNAKPRQLVTKQEAEEIIKKAVENINNQEFENKFSLTSKTEIKDVGAYKLLGNQLYTNEKYQIGEFIYLEEEKTYKKITDVGEGFYVVNDPSFEELVEDMDLEGTYEVDFEDAIDIPGGIIEDDSLYVNNKRELLASSSKTFNTSGFRVSYNFNSSGIHARISKSISGVNTFFDVSLSNIKPSYKWKYEKGQLQDAYFKVGFKSTTQVGASVGKYNNFYLDLKDKDSSSFLNSIKSIISKEEDEIEASIKICEIKTPIPQVPTAYFNIEVVAKIYTTGKVELVLYNSNCLGLEVKDGSLRLIHDVDKDIDLTIGGSTKAVLGLNFNLQAISTRLMDVEVDGGIRAGVSTTAHLYDEDGKKTSTTIDYPYSSVDELSKENENVKICGDVSLNWILDLKFNTSKTLLYKFGLSKDKEILNENDQVFKNKSHIENGVFVEKCTRKDKLTHISSQTTNITSDKIVLQKYSAVVVVGNTYQIPIKALPEGYSVSDLCYSSLDENIASASNNGSVQGKNMGACEIKITTSDGKYSASINILVSSG